MNDWSKKITELAAKLEAVYIYFNNDVEGFALRNAAELRDFLESSH
jgi:uncharacterized protein YecE (DUF72 family)